MVTAADARSSMQPTEVPVTIKPLTVQPVTSSPPPARPPSGATTTSARGVRRARRLHAARRRRRPDRVLRAVRAAAPRPGGRRHRRQRRHRARLHKDAGPGRQRVHPGDAGAAHRLPRASATPATAPPAANAQRNIQPFLVETMHGPLALAHNGNLVNAAALREELLQPRLRPHRHERHRGDHADAGRRRRHARGRSASSARMPAWKGAYSLVHARRRPGDRRARPVGLPAAVASAACPHGGYAVASETCALSTLGCVDISEVAAGRDRHAAGRRAAPPPGAARRPRQPARCTFEFVYFSRPDSVWDGRNVHHVRQRLGEELADESPVDADVVDPRARLVDPRRHRLQPGAAASRTTTG